MRVGILLPGFSAGPDDWAIPVQLNLVRLMARSESVRVLALRYPHSKGEYTVHGAEVHALGAGQARGLRRLLLWWRALRLIERLHQEEPFDVLHAMWADETGLVAVWAGHRLGVRVMVSLAGGELARLPEVDYGLQRGRFSRWIVGQALEGADRITTACGSIERLIGERGYRVPAERRRRVYLGVDRGLFHPDATTPRLPKRLIQVGSLIGVKDQAMLLRAVRRLDADVRVDVIGSGPLEGALKQQAVQLGIAEQVRFVGNTQHPDLPSHYRQAALHVLTSRHEGMGLVTAEAAACGLPTVGTAVGLLADFPELGPSVPVGDDAALAQAIQELLRDDTARLARGTQAARLAAERLTIEATVDQLRQIYQELA